MADRWPTDLTLGSHVLWRFQLAQNPLLRTFVVLAGSDHVRRVDLHINYIPVLGCFDLNYWMSMLVDEDKKESAVHTKRYMQNVRHAVVDAIFEVNKVELVDGSWNMSVIVPWAIRTWYGFSHSLWGRQKYLERCEKRKQIPYEKKLSMHGTVLFQLK